MGMIYIDARDTFLCFGFRDLEARALNPQVKYLANKPIGTYFAITSFAQNKLQ